MTLLTNDRLKAMFQQSRERKEKERQEQRLEKQQQYRDLCKEADRLLKQALQDEKRKRMEQLSTLIKKTSQKPLKQPYINLDNNRWIDENKYINDFSREELEQLCPHCIRWDVWDKVVEQTKQQLGITDTKPLKHKKKRTRLWTYTNGQLLNEYFDCSAAAREFGRTVGTIHEYMSKGLTIKGITFSNKPLEL